MRATTHIPALLVKAATITDRVRLDHHERHRRRFMLTTLSGKEFLLDLETTTALRHGDGLRLEDGGVILVEAAPEALLQITSPNPLRLLKAAWHIGNRHTPSELAADAIYLAADHVLEPMLRGLGVEVKSVMRPFEPERGAYHAHD